MDILEIPFVGAYELRKNLPLLLRQLEQKNEGLVVTQKGKPAAVMLTVKKYLELKVLTEELEDSLKDAMNKDYLLELAQADHEIKSGKGKSAKKLFKELNI